MKNNLIDVSETLSWGLLKYSVQNVMEDNCLELAAVRSISDKDSGHLIQQVLRWYHEGQGSCPAISPELFSIIVHITQSYRIPVMTVRMDLALDVLRGRGNIKTVLDYGGGGGKDSIIFARSGYDVTFSDFQDLMTPWVKKRFEIRDLKIAMEDVRSLTPRRYSCINCMDVLEHVYDFEFTLADVIARLEPGGILVCWPALYNEWSGDHKAKNCAYNYFFEYMMAQVGMKTVREHRLLGIMCYVKEQTHDTDILQERALVRKRLYEISRRVTMRRGIKALIKLPGRLGRAWFEKDPIRHEHLVEKAISDVIDNADVYRLSNHRLVCETMDGEFANKT